MVQQIAAALTHPSRGEKYKRFIPYAGPPQA